MKTNETKYAELVAEMGKLLAAMKGEAGLDDDEMAIVCEDIQVAINDNLEVAAF